MSPMKKELLKILICSGAGIILGLIFGIPVDIENEKIEMSLFMPLIFTLFSIGWVYGLPWVVKMLGYALKLSGTGLLYSILGIGRGGFPWGGIFIFLFGLQIFALMLAISWMPGVFLAGKALWNAHKNSGGESWSTDKGEWDDENFGERSSKRERERKTPKPRKEKVPLANSEDDFSW